VTLKVSVAIALPGRQEVLELALPDGSTAGDAVKAAGIPERFPGMQSAGLALGIWSRPCEAHTALRDGDRVELYRPLQADPKVQRRERARLKPSIRSRNGS
jgi:putative ubiquitin-RnfH superfamily antitoxin RatB of RatAB toxin-antitoxin module